MVSTEHRAPQQSSLSDIKVTMKKAALCKELLQEQGHKGSTSAFQTKHSPPPGSNPFSPGCRCCGRGWSTLNLLADGNVPVTLDCSYAERFQKSLTPGTVTALQDGKAGTQVTSCFQELAPFPPCLPY